MATITITNLTAAPIFLRDLYTSIGPAGNTNTAFGPSATLVVSTNVSAAPTNGVVSPSTGGGPSAIYGLLGGPNRVARSPTDVMRMYQIQQLLAAGSITVSVVADTNEISSGFGTQADAAGFSEIVTMRVPLAAAAINSDTSVFAVNTLPYKFRVINAWLVTPTAVAGSLVTLWSRAAAAGTQMSGAMSGAAVGVSFPGASAPATVATAALAPAALDGLFARLTGAGPYTGELFAMIARSN